MDGQLTIESEFSNDPDKSRKTGVKCTTFKMPLSCSQCGKAFTTKSKLDCHARIHTNERPFSCLKCDYRCTTSGNLMTHERIHTDEKPFSCSKCDKTFTQAHNLKIHERIHTGEKPFSCSKCEKNFSDGSAWKRHERIHADEKRAAPSVTRHSETQLSLSNMKEETTLYLNNTYSKSGKQL